MDPLLKDDGETVFETQMRLKIYSNMGDGITLEQDDSMQNEPSMISFDCDDVEAVIRALRAVKKQIRTGQT